ncbi:MAG: DUF169 domain-containing protein [Candidatus Omnitrophota bacterium]
MKNKPMENNEWKVQAKRIKEVLGLELSPVAIACLKEPVVGGDIPAGRIRMCRAILDAAAGNTLRLRKDNNACFGADHNLGFGGFGGVKAAEQARQFVVEGEKLFCSYDALDKLASQMSPVPDNSGSCFILSPVENADFQAQLIVFICNAEEASRILSLAVFMDGIMPKLKIGGPTCRMAILEPLLTGELNISFYDYTSRRLCKVDKNKLLVSVPVNRMSALAASLEKCSAGTAKVEYPRQLRGLLRRNKEK